MILQTLRYKTETPYSDKDAAIEGIFDDPVMRGYLIVYQEVLSKHFETGSLMFKSTELSDDGKTLEVIRMWKNQEDYDRYKDEGNRLTNKEYMDLYYSNNNIMVEEIVKPV